MKSLLRLTALLAAVAALLAWNKTAIAQTSAATITVNMSGITRSNSSHPNNNGTANDISKQDCLNGDVMTIPVTAMYTDTSLTFQVWVANNADCTISTNRSGTTAVCSKVYENSTFPTQGTSIDLPVRDIVYGLNHPGTDARGLGSADQCDNITQTNAQPQKLDVWFMFVSGLTADASAMDLPLKYSLIGPTAPTGFKAGSGDTALILSWDAAAVGTVAGYYIFCDPKPGNESLGNQVLDASSFQGSSGTGGAGGAGGSGGTAGMSGLCDASADADDAADATDACTPGSGGSTGAGGSSGAAGSAGTTTGSSCLNSSGVLVGGAVPSQNLFASNQCGTTEGGSANGGLVPGLINNSPYTISVAAFDLLGNTGGLAAPACGIPEKIDDFANVYRARGGTALGSSFCSLSSSSLGRRSTGGAAGAMLVGLALALHRARGRRARDRARTELTNAS